MARDYGLKDWRLETCNIRLSISGNPLPYLRHSSSTFFTAAVRFARLHPPHKAARAEPPADQQAALTGLPAVQSGGKFSIVVPLANR
jgi:hypothetical protein